MNAQNPISVRPLFRASPSIDDVQDLLGPLAELPGTWTGRGFNLIALPDMVLAHPDDPKFRLMVSATHETLMFAPTGSIPNRGNAQDDITFFGLHYFQEVHDAETDGLLHIEPGLWLNLPATTAPPADASVVRLSTIPHGDALLAQGTSFTIDGCPQIDKADSTPFTLDPDGNRVNDQNVTTYLAPYTSTPVPPGIPAGSIADPNIVLNEVISKQNIVQTVTLIVNAAPIGGINGTKPAPPSAPNNGGSILNIPFVDTNANANSFSAIFWIETVQNEDGSRFMQLQYTQTLILDFPVPAPNGDLVGIKWPHISVATLIKR